MSHRWLPLRLLSVALALLIAALFTAHLLLTPAPGSILVLASGPVPGRVAAGPLQLHSAQGWLSLRDAPAIPIPKAPVTATLVEADVPARAYDGVRWGGSYLPLRFLVARDRLTTLLIGVEDGRPSPDQAYAGGEAVSLGLNELSGQLRKLPGFALLDQFGRPFNNANLAGHVAVLAAFNTACHQTCPLYTGLFFDLRRRLPPSVLLIEATTDPAHDTPQALRDYAGRLGASWTFLTGPAPALAAFWKPFDVALSTGNVHRSELAVIDTHGFIRSYYQGAPDLTGALPASLAGELDGRGRKELASHGDGWGIAQVLDTLQLVGGSGGLAGRAGGPATDFRLPTLDGNTVSLSEFRGRPVLINFWASWCVPCRQEMPMIVRLAKRYPSLQVLLVNERDSPAAARGFLSSLGVTDAAVPLDEDGRVGDLYSVPGLPTSLFVRGDGSLQGSYIGQMDEAVLVGHLDAISH